MPDRIEELTPEQEARLPEWRDRWIALGLSTEPADRQTAEDALRKCYNFAELKGDDLRFVWVNSPDEIGEEVRKLGWKGSVWGAYCGGQTWAAWPAYESFFREVAGLELPGDLSQRGAAYAALIANTGPMLLFDDVAVMCERPAVIRMVEGRLHAEGQPAIEWRDGTGIYAWRGQTVVEAKYVCDPPTVAWIDAEDNAELRRVLLERMGVEKFLTEAGAETVDDDPRWGRLLRRTMGEGEEDVWAVIVTCPTTGRRYAMGVHHEIRPLLGTESEYGDPQKPTARNAVASGFGLRGEEYDPYLET